MSGLGHLEAALQELAEHGLLRDDQPTLSPSNTLLLCSNDYLGYARDGAASWGVEAPSGAGASRLISGDHEATRSAEQCIAKWVGDEACLLFTSGYAANLGALSCLAGPGDVIFSDALNHASIIDGCRLSGARTVVIRHLDLEHLERALRDERGVRRWVVTESCFSMDGDQPNLGDLRGLCDRHEAALYVDEAHGVGVFGDRGAGLCGQHGVLPDVRVGTLGKALGLQGAFVSGSRSLRKWLWNRARSFVFSTGMSPRLATAIERRVDEVGREPARRERLRLLCSTLRGELAGIVAASSTEGPILPWVLGSSERALAAASALRTEGIFVPAIRPPTVAQGAARLRITVHAALTDEDLARAARAIRRVARGLVSRETA